MQSQTILKSSIKWGYQHQWRIWLVIITTVFGAGILWQHFSSVPRGGAQPKVGVTQVVQVSPTPALELVGTTSQNRLLPSGVDLAELNDFSQNSNQAITRPSGEPTQSRTHLTQSTISLQTYTVEKGDSLWGLATKYLGDGHRSVEIAQANNLALNARLEIGQELQVAWPRAGTITAQAWSGESSELDLNQSQPNVQIVPVNVRSDSLKPTVSGVSRLEIAPQVGAYVIASGDTLWSIASEILGDGYRWTEIYQLNKAQLGSNPGLIFQGMQLQLPS